MDGMQGCRECSMGQAAWFGSACVHAKSRQHHRRHLMCTIVTSVIVMPRVGKCGQDERDRDRDMGVSLRRHIGPNASINENA